MNQQERDALRKKHQDWSGHCPVCHTETACDVIKVLDAWEAEVHDGSEVSAIREVCDHEKAYFADNGLPRHPLSALWYDYCPSCGEKL